MRKHTSKLNTEVSGGRKQRSCYINCWRTKSIANRCSINNCWAEFKKTANRLACCSWLDEAWISLFLCFSFCFSWCLLFFFFFFFLFLDLLSSLPLSVFFPVSLPFTYQYSDHYVGSSVSLPNLLMFCIKWVETGKSWAEGVRMDAPALPERLAYLLVQRGKGSNPG